MVQSQGHAAASLNRDLAQLVAQLKAMGSGVADQLALVRAALAAPKPGLLEQIKAADKLVNAQEEEIEAEIFALLSRHHPMLQDLRFVAYTLKLTSILERIGDLAKNAVRRLNRLEIPIPADMLGAYEQLALGAHHMLTKSILLVEGFDAAAAEAVVAEDDRLDALFKKTKKLLFAKMKENPDHIVCLNHLQFIARNLERSGDYAAEIARILIFVHTGEKAVKNKA